MSDYSEPAKASLILPTGSESKYYRPAAVEADGWTHDPDKAIDILENELKAKKGSDGIYALPDGTRLGGWKLITPTGWTDWNTACEIVAKSAKAVGIGIMTEFPQAPTMHASDAERRLRARHVRLLRCQPGQSVDPVPRRARRPGRPGVGKPAFWNYNRFKNADVPALLDAAAGAKPTPRPRGLRRSRHDLPRGYSLVPLMYRPLEFYEFNASNWTNFPTEENPYAPPMWQGAGIQWLFKIKKVGT